MALALALFSTRGRPKWWLICAAGIGGLPTVISVSRHGYVAMAIGLIVIAAVLFRSGRLGQLRMIMLFALTLLIAGQAIELAAYNRQGVGGNILSAITDRWTNLFEQATVVGRNIEVKMAMTLLEDSPLVGGGLGVSRPVSPLEPRYLNSQGERYYENQRYVHNGYFDLAIRAGLIGLVLLAALLLNFLRQIWKTYSAAKGTSWAGMAVGLLALGIYTPVTSAFESAFVNRVYLIWLVVLLAMAEATQSHAEAERQCHNVVPRRQSGGSAISDVLGRLNP